MLEDIAVDTLVHSSSGTVVMRRFQGLLTAPSWQTFPSLACGWAVATDRHTLTTSLWLTGATAVQHLSRFSLFLGCPLYQQRWPLWGAVIRLAAPFVPAGEVIRVSCDDTTKQKAGTHIEGLARYRHGAGAARQAYRTLRGVHCVLGLMPMPLTRWPGHARSVPRGCALSRTAPHAQTRHVPYQARSQLARALLDCVAEQVPGRPIRRCADGGDATKDSVRRWPEAVHVVGAFAHQRHALRGAATPPPHASRCPTQKRRPDRRAQDPGPDRHGVVAPPPSAAGAERQAWDGLWHAVLPGRLVRVVVLRRPGNRALKQPRQSTPPPAIDAFFTTALSLSAQDMVREYSVRWAVDIALRDANAFAGLGQAQCRKHQRLMGANTLRLVMAAARTLWCIEQVERGTAGPLCRYRPWSRQQVAPRQLDVAEACREALHEAGIFPIPRFTPELAENDEEPE